MFYSQDKQVEIEEHLGRLPEMELDLHRRLDRFRLRLTNDVAVEYLYHGVARRMTVLSRCIVNTFDVYPVALVHHVDAPALSDAMINLHAFVINVSGVLDNLAFVYAHERLLVGRREDRKFNRKQVGLFYRPFQERMPKALVKYLRSPGVSDWHTQCSKNYRDALAHRVPLYIAPAVITSEEDRAAFRELDARMLALSPEDWNTRGDLLKQQGQLGQPSPFFGHSLSEATSQVYLHPQILSDFMTLEALIGRFCECVDEETQNNAREIKTPTAHF